MIAFVERTSLFTTLCRFLEETTGMWLFVYEGQSLLIEELTKVCQLVTGDGVEIM